MACEYVLQPFERGYFGFCLTPTMVQVLHGLLTGCFKGQKGHDMVQRQDYALEEGATGRDLNKDLPLYRCLRRGMKVYMSMIFQSTEVVVGACPRCHTVTESPQDVNIQWYVAQIFSWSPQKYVLTVTSKMEDCGMWFRVQKQVIETPHMDPASRGGDDRLDETPVRQDATAVTSIPVTPGDFQRVRLQKLEFAESSEVSIPQL